MPNGTCGGVRGGLVSTYSIINFVQSVAYIGKKSSLTRALNSCCKLTLMLCAGSGNAAGKNLRTLGNEFLQSRNIFVIDNFNFIGAESANLLFSMHIRTE